MDNALRLCFRLTGYSLIKLGKATAAAIGSGIILLQIANHNGYIKINWDKVTKKAEELSEKIDEKSTKPNLMKKVSENSDIYINILFFFLF